MKILIVDDHRLIRHGLRAVLEREGFDVVGEAGSGQEAIGLVSQLKPNIVLMDISMPGLNGIDATKRLLAEQPQCKVIALSMNSDRRYVVAMFDAGAVGYLVKDSAAEELTQAIGAVSRGLSYVTPQVASSVIDRCVRGAASGGFDDTLTPREREVLQLVAEGHSSKEIANLLNLALPTVESHRRQIMAKVNKRTVADLVKYAIREGITSL